MTREIRQGRQGVRKMLALEAASLREGLFCPWAGTRDPSPHEGCFHGSFTFGPPQYLSSYFNLDSGVLCT